MNVIKKTTRKTIDFKFETGSVIKKNSTFGLILITTET